MTKPTKWHVCPVKTQISLTNQPGHLMKKAKTDQTGWMPRLSLLGVHAILMVSSCSGLYVI